MIEVGLRLGRQDGGSACRCAVKRIKTERVEHRQRTYDVSTARTLAIAGVGTGLPALLGTKIGALTAWAGSAPLGVGESGNLGADIEYSCTIIRSERVRTEEKRAQRHRPSDI